MDAKNEQMQKSRTIFVRDFYVLSQMVEKNEEELVAFHFRNNQCRWNVREPQAFVFNVFLPAF